MESQTTTLAPSSGGSPNDGLTAWRGLAVWAAAARWPQSLRLGFPCLPTLYLKSEWKCCVVKVVVDCFAREHSQADTRFFSETFWAVRTFSRMRYGRSKPRGKLFWVSPQKMFENRLKMENFYINNPVRFIFLGDDGILLKTRIPSFPENLDRIGLSMQSFETWAYFQTFFGDTQKVSRRVWSFWTSSSGRYLYPRKFHWKI